MVDTTAEERVVGKNAQLVISTATSLPPSPTLNTPIPAPHLRATTPGGPIVFPRAHEQHRRPGGAVVERSFLPRSAPPHPPKGTSTQIDPSLKVQKRTRLTERNERCDPTSLKTMRMLLHTHTGSLRGTVNPAVGVKEKSIYVRLAFIQPLTHTSMSPPTSFNIFTQITRKEVGRRVATAHDREVKRMCICGHQPPSSPCLHHPLHTSSTSNQCDSIHPHSTKESSNFKENGPPPPTASRVGSACGRGPRSPRCGLMRREATSHPSTAVGSTHPPTHTRDTYSVGPLQSNFRPVSQKRENERDGGTGKRGKGGEGWW